MAWCIFDHPVDAVVLRVDPPDLVEEGLVF